MHDTHHIYAVDLNEFRALMNRDDEAFLWQTLSRSVFVRLKRSRIRVIWKYVRRIANNAAIVKQFAEGSRQDANVDVAEAATKVLDMASQLRRQCRIAYAKLAVEYMFPAISIRMRK